MADYVGSGYGDLAEKPQYQAAVTLNGRFGENGRLGYSLSGNFQQANRATHNNELRWDDRKDVNGNTIPFALREIELRNYFNERNRYGVSGQLEYRPDPNNRYHIGGFFNRRDDSQRRDQFRIRVDRGNYLSRTEVERARMVRALQDRTESQTIASVNGGGRHTLGNVKLNYQAAYSYGEQVKEAPDEQILPEFQLDSKVNLRLDLADMDAPQEPGIGYEAVPEIYELFMKLL